MYNIFMKRRLPFFGKLVINQKKITAHDRIAEVVSEMDKHKDIDLDMLVDSLSDIRDLLVWDEPDQAN